MITLKNNGAKALGNAWAGTIGDREGPTLKYCELVAKQALGTNGLFIADVTKHEPIFIGIDATVLCHCNHRTFAGESYFDHIGEE